VLSIFSHKTHQDHNFTPLLVKDEVEGANAQEAGPLVPTLKDKKKSEEKPCSAAAAAATARARARARVIEGASRADVLITQAI
jgi:hypothetical protein